jgi:hypothetical protein
MYLQWNFLSLSLWHLIAGDIKELLDEVYADKLELWSYYSNS